ncbi:MAG: orotidine-5'-phosphate decarboxylase [Minisyncoccia bacterium]
MNNKPRIIIAADNMEPLALIQLMRRVGRNIHAVKINDAFDHYGPIIVRQLKDVTERVWVDVKLHDIPNTVKNRAATLDGIGADIITVHALGGMEMMVAAVEGARGGAKIYAVTVLTSHDQRYVSNMFECTIDHLVLKLAAMASDSGVQGIVCSPKELLLIKEYRRFEHLDLVTPGVRSVGADVGDQKRVDTPRAAISAGANYIVVGRQITEAPDPVAALEAIEAEIADVS